MPDPPELSWPDQLTVNEVEFTVAGNGFTLLLGATISFGAFAAAATIGGSKLPMIGVANSSKKFVAKSPPSGVGLNGWSSKVIECGLGGGPPNVSGTSFESRKNCWAASCGRVPDRPGTHRPISVTPS